MKRRTFLGSLLAGLLASPGLALARPDTMLVGAAGLQGLDAWLPTDGQNFFGIDRTFATQPLDASWATISGAIEALQASMRERDAMMAVPRWLVPQEGWAFGPGDTDDRAEPW